MVPHVCCYKFDLEAQLTQLLKSRFLFLSRRTLLYSFYLMHVGQEYLGNAKLSPEFLSPIGVEIFFKPHSGKQAIFWGPSALPQHDWVTRPCSIP